MKSSLQNNTISILVGCMYIFMKFVYVYAYVYVFMTYMYIFVGVCI